MATTIDTTLTNSQVEDLVGDISSTTVISSSTTEIILGLTYEGDDLPHASTLVITGVNLTGDLSSGTINSLNFRDASNNSMLLIGGLSMTTTEFNALLANSEQFEDFVEDLMPGEDVDDHGGRKGNDTHEGTSGDDTIHYDDSSARVTVNLTTGTSRGQGDDTLISIENVVGSRGSDNITGSDDNNELDGIEGNDKIFGLGGDDDILGGKGNDQLDGGAGDDFLDGDDGNDKLFGRDGVDELTGGKGNDHLDGGAGNDLLDGGDGNDKLTGGDGDDMIDGGSGNDNIIAGSGLNQVFAGSGNDKITAGDDADIIDGGDGNDTIMSGGGNDSIFGGAGKDNIKAGAGDDLIDGGSGADNMAGGADNDTYVVDDAKDKIVERANEGNDTVEASFSFSLEKFANVENITLTNAATSATGNAGDNTLIGNDVNNTLSGGGGNDTLDGGLGNDTLTGGTGNDNFVFDNLGGADSITDFDNGDDMIMLDNLTFTSLTTEGVLAGGNFVSGAGAVAVEADDFLIFDTTSGALYYDANGSTGGSADAVQIATVTLSAGATLDAGDFTVI